MGGESPVSELYNSDGYALSVYDGVAIPAFTPTIITAGSDGTNSRYLAVNSSGQQIIIGAGTAGTPVGGVLSIQGVSGGQAVPISGSVTVSSGSITVSGTVTANQGTANSVGNGWPVKITDGTNVLGTLSNPVRTDPTGTTTQPVSGTVTANAGSGNFAVVQATAALLNATVTANGNFNNASVSATAASPPASATYIGGSVTTSSPTYTTGQMNALSLTTAGALRIDGSAVTQPVSGTVTANAGSGTFTVAGTVTANQGTSPWVTNITQFGGSNIVTGTGTSGSGIPRVTVSNDSNILATQSGTWTVAQGTAAALSGKWPVQITDGTNTMPTGDTAGRAIFEKLTDGTNGPVAVKPASTAAVAADPSLVVTISPDSASLTVSVSNTPSNSTPTIVYGDVALNSITTSSVRRTTYTEQSSNFTGSVVSSNANDTSAGTGARQVKIYYVDSTGATAGNETVTMNGTTAVNLVTTTKCFIERMEVISVGSTGSNVGTISLFTGAAGGGTLVGTIGATDNKTFWAHHYVITGKTFNLTSLIAGSTQSVAANGSSWVLKAKTIGVATAVDVQINDTVTLYGQSSQVTRNYTTAIPVATGPSRVLLYVTTLASASATYRGAFDFYET